MSWWKFWEDGEEESPDYYAEGVALIRQGEYLEAVNRFRLVLRDRPDDVAAHAQIGVAYQKAELYDEAVKKYREALELDPGHAGAHFGLGFVLRKQGRNDAAMRHLQEFLQAASGETVPDRQVELARETLEELRGGGADGDGAATGAGEGPDAG